jgi:hypothetical protein
MAEPQAAGRPVFRSLQPSETVRAPSDIFLGGQRLEQVVMLKMNPISRRMLTSSVGWHGEFAAEDASSLHGPSVLISVRASFAEPEGPS